MKAVLKTYKKILVIAGTILIFLINIDASGKISAAKGAASLNLSKPQIDQLINELGSALVEISVGPDEDIEKIRQLIRNSAEWYQSRIPALVDGPWLIDASRFRCRRHYRMSGRILRGRNSRLCAPQSADEYGGAFP